MPFTAGSTSGLFTVLQGVCCSTPGMLPGGAAGSWWQETWGTARQRCCASCFWRGRRFIAMIGLRFEGARVRPIPRKFHLKVTSLDQLPELRPVAADCGRYEGPRGTIIPIDPTVLGREWVADPGGVDAVFLLERNFAGNTHLSALPGSSVATALTHHITNYHSGNRKEMRALLKLAASVSGYRVRVGDLGQAVEQIREVLDERIPARAIRPSATPDAVSVDRDRHLG